MLRRKDKRNGADFDEPQGKVLEIDAEMQGSLSFKDPVNILINGNFEGTLDTLGILTIGERASVKATIKGETVILKGELVGDLTVSESLSLCAKARLIGDIQTPSLSIETGAILQGQVDMTTETTTSSKGSESSFFNVDELASYLSVEKSLIFEWADSGKLPGTRRGSNWKFEKEKVDEWVASGMIK